MRTPEREKRLSLKVEESSRWQFENSPERELARTTLTLWREKWFENPVFKMLKMAQHQFWTQESNDVLSEEFGKDHTFVIWGIWKGSRLIADFPFYPSSHLSGRLVLENPQTLWGHKFVLPKINFEKSLEGKWNTKLYFPVFKWLSYQQIRQTRCLKTPICPHILKPIKETTS